MNPTLALFASILVGGLSQIVLKQATNHGVRTSKPGGRGFWISLLSSVWIWLFAIMLPVATILWIFAVSRLEISYAFPMLSASYVLVALLSKVFLKESLGWQRWIAIAVICFGVVLIARG